MSAPASPPDSRPGAAPSAQRPRSAVNQAARGLRLIARLPAGLLLGIIRLYQRTLSPLLPVVTAGACGCRFSPTCSHYAAEAIRGHGALAGTWLALRRLVKCTPLHPGGFDPVPTSANPRPASVLKPWCRRVA